MMKQDVSKQFVGAKLQAARECAGMTQEALGIALAEKVNKDCPYSVSMISALEQGRKKPKDDSQVLALANILDVEPDVFYSELSFSSNEEEISHKDICKYINMPVFLVFESHEHEDSFYLVKDQFTFISPKGEVLELPKNQPLRMFRIYRLPFYSVMERDFQGSKPLTMARIKTSDKVWIEMTSHDNTVRNTYNGWYYYNNDAEMFIKVSDGLPLPLTGYGKSFKVFAEPYNDVDYSM